MRSTWPKLCAVCLVGLVTLTSLLAQAGTEPSPSPAPADLAKTQNLEDARKALRFGIDATVLSVIQQATASRDTRVKDDVQHLITSANPDVQVAVMDYFAALEDWAGPGGGLRSMVVEYQDTSSKSLIRALRFLDQAKMTPEADVSKAIVDLARNGAKDRQLAAIQALGALKITDAASILRELFEKSGLAIEARRAAIEALGKKKDATLLSFFRDLYDDAGEDKEVRRQALGAIGLLANAEGLKTVRKASASADLFERRSAAYALDGYALNEVEDLYRQALRDPAWQNRRGVIQQIGTKGYAGFADALLYMAEKDPEAAIRAEAMRSLVQVGAGFDQINQWISNEKASSELRILALSESLRKAPERVLGSLGLLFDQEWKTPNSRLILAAAKELGSAKVDASVLYARLLTYPNEDAKLYAIQGIQTNKLFGLKTDLKRLQDTKPDGRLKAALDEALK